MATRALQDLRSAAGPNCTPAAERRFKAPPPGALAANDDRHDPLKYYYAPLVGLLYRNRIESGLALLRPPFDSILEIGYRHIDDFHVTRHRDLIACSAPYFVLRELRRFPFPAPRWAALYFNMLFERTDTPA